LARPPPRSTPTVDALAAQQQAVGRRSHGAGQRRGHMRRAVALTHTLKEELWSSRITMSSTPGGAS
jgi:hypothetical protein